MVSCTGGCTLGQEERTVLCPELSTALSVCERRMILRLIPSWGTPVSPWTVRALSITFSCKLVTVEDGDTTAGPSPLHHQTVNSSVTKSISEIFNIILGYSSYRISNPVSSYKHKL